MISLTQLNLEFSIAVGREYVVVGCIILFNIHSSWNMLMKLSMLPKTVALVHMLVYPRHRSPDFEESMIG